MSWMQKWRRKRPEPLSTYPTLQTERLVLRAFDPSDAVDVFAYAQSPIVGPMAGWPPHQTIDESRAVVQRFIAHGDVWAIVEKRTGHVIGSIDLHVDAKREVDGARTLGYALGENSWGQGFATEAALAVLHFAFEQLNCRILSVYHFPQNPKSKHVIKKLGFTYEGVLRMASVLPSGELADDMCYSLTREEFAAQQAELEARLAASREKAERADKAARK
ncbi:MAG: GNAT family protein [Eubacteriales bacterium]|nr:GNAT family protein [Eubacteriales bacterium]